MILFFALSDEYDDTLKCIAVYLYPQSLELFVKGMLPWITK